MIEKERPDGIMLAFGGQTALNCGVALYKDKVFEKYGVKVLGTPVQAIIDTEDREIFVQKLDEIDVKTIQSEAVEMWKMPAVPLPNWAIRSLSVPRMPLADWVPGSVTMKRN